MEGYLIAVWSEALAVSADYLSRAELVGNEKSPSLLALARTRAH